MAEPNEAPCLMSGGVAANDSAEWDALREKLRGLEIRYGRLQQLLEVLHALSGEMSLDRLLGRIMDQATRVVDADRSSLLLYDKQTDELWSKIAQGLDTTEIRFRADQGLAGHVVKTGEVLNIADAYDDPRFNQEVDRKTGYRTRSMLCMPMISRRGEVMGVIQVLNKKGGAVFGSEDEESLGALATNAAAFIENAQLYGQIEALFEAFVKVSITAIDERDPTTSGHSTRVAACTMKLARLVHEDDGPRFGKTEFSREEFRQLRYASLLHDYGKIGVRENVLCKATRLSGPETKAVRERCARVIAEKRLAAAERKLAGEDDNDAALQAELDRIGVWWETVERVNGANWLGDEDAEELEAMHEAGLLDPQEHENLAVRRGNLTAAEWEDMKSHVTRSFHILRQVPWPDDLRDLPEISYSHHEKLNGSGYPRGLHEDEIPLGGKMMCVADIYDALTASDRPYRKAMPHERACEILREEAERGALDGDLVELFIRGRAWDIEKRRPAALLESVA